MAEMTQYSYILPMTFPIRQQRILFVVYDGFEIMDLAGPASVFTAASKLHKNSPYQVVTVAPEQGLIASETGIAVQCIGLRDLRIKPQDTLIVVGANERSLTQIYNNTTFLNWLTKQTPRANRFGSVCSGALLLGAAGLLENRSVTSHWAACEELAQRHPNTQVNADALYIQDKNLWTSAGVASGIDMALAIVEQDFGSNLRGEVAKWIVVYAHRPGYQSQFSPLLKAQNASETFANLCAWIDSRLAKNLSVSFLADHMAMTERSFYRKFSAAMNMTPAKYVERARLNKSKELLAAGMPVKQVAAEVGFLSESGFRQAFDKNFGLSPSVHRSLHAQVPLETKSR